MWGSMTSCTAASGCDLALGVAAGSLEGACVGIESEHCRYRFGVKLLACWGHLHSRYLGEFLLFPVQKL